MTYFVKIACALMVLVPSVSVAADAKAGRKLARKCSVCHGKLGVSKDPEVPIIAGQHALYIEKELKLYRDGGRQDRRMSLMAKPLTDEQIKDLAAWFSSLKVTVEVPD